MAIARLIPSTYQLSNTSYLAITNAGNMYANTDSTNYATIQNKQTGTTSYYLYVRGFNFDAIPSNATVSSFTVKFKARESGVSTSTSYRPYLVNNTSTLTGNCGVVNTTEQVITFTGVTADWDTIKGYGSNFGIRINCRRNSRNTTGYVYFYGAEIEVEYTVPIPRKVTASAAGDCTVTPSGETNLIEGDDFTLTVQADRKPTLTDNGVDVTSQLVEHEPTIEPTVSTASGASYGFAVNSSGYYESQNKGRAGTAAVCKVDFDLPVQCTVKFSVINYAESTYDYGLLSNVDATLSNSASADTSNVFWDGKNKNSASVQDVTYTIPAGSHFVYVKYFKDNYTDSNNDTLQFKVTVTPNETYDAKPYWTYTISSISADHVLIATVDPSGDVDTLYVQISGVVREVSVIYKKVNGSYVEVRPRDFDQTAKYVMV